MFVNLTWGWYASLSVSEPCIRDDYAIQRFMQPMQLPFTVVYRSTQLKLNLYFLRGSPRTYDFRDLWQIYRQFAFSVLVKWYFHFHHCLLSKILCKNAIFPFSAMRIGPSFKINPFSIIHVRRQVKCVFIFEQCFIFSISHDLCLDH